MVKVMADVFTAASVLAGLWAALLWWRSGQVDVDPKWKLEGRTGLPNPTIENIIQDLKVMTQPERTQAFNDALALSAKFNGHAAVWTAASVTLQAVATVLGRFASP